MKTRTTTWAAQIAVVLVLMASGMASGATGFLSWNSPLGKNVAEAGYCPATTSLSGGTHQGCGEGSLQDAAGLFVAPGTVRPIITQRTGTTMAQVLEGVPDNAMIHLTRQPTVAAIESGGLEYGSSMVRAGDVRGMTLAQFQRDVVGPLAEARAADANSFVIVRPTSPQYGTIQPWPRPNTPLPGTSVQEFRPAANVMPNEIIQVQPPAQR